MKYLGSSKANARLSFYRTRSGMEIDFCIETSQGIFVIEAKNRDAVVRSDFTSMTRLSTATGELY